MNLSENHTRILRRPEVEKRTGLCRSSLYAQIAAGEFPQPVKIGARAVGWVEADIESWINKKIHSKGNADAGGQV